MTVELRKVGQLLAIAFARARETVVDRPNVASVLLGFLVFKFEFEFLLFLFWGTNNN